MIYLKISSVLVGGFCIMFFSALCTFIITAFAKERFIDQAADVKKDRENYRLKKHNQELIAENERLRRRAEDLGEHLDEIERTFSARELRKRNIA